MKCEAGTTCRDPKNSDPKKFLVVRWGDFTKVVMAHQKCRGNLYGRATPTDLPLHRLRKGR